MDCVLNINPEIVARRTSERHAGDTPHKTENGSVLTNLATDGYQSHVVTCRLLSLALSLSPSASSDTMSKRTPSSPLDATGSKKRRIHINTIITSTSNNTLRHIRLTQAANGKLSQRRKNKKTTAPPPVIDVDPDDEIDGWVNEPPEDTPVENASHGQPNKTKTKKKKKKSNTNSVSPIPVVKLVTSAHASSYQVKLTEFLPFRDSCLDELLRHEGQGDSMGLKCQCGNATGIFKCTDCFSQLLVCRECIIAAHASLPLHRIQVVSI